MGFWAGICVFVCLGGCAPWTGYSQQSLFPQDVDTIYLHTVALLRRRTRLAASLVAIVFVVTLQLAAREVGFALLFANLLLLFPERDWGRRLLPGVAGLYLYAVGAAAGWLPGGFFFEAGSL